MSDYGGSPSSNKNSWTSLEVVKLIVGVITPLTIAWVGYVIWDAQQNAIQRWEARQQEERKLAEAELRERDRLRDHRLTIYKDAGPLLNDILAYHFYVGKWRQFSPAQIIEKKRNLDSLMYSHEALFTPAFFDLYRIFMAASFRSARNGHGESRLRTRSTCRTPASDEEQAKWQVWFTDEDNRRGVCIAYRNLLGRLSEELLFKSIATNAATDDQKVALCPPQYTLADCP